MRIASIQVQRPSADQRRRIVPLITASNGQEGGRRRIVVEYGEEPFPFETGGIIKIVSGCVHYVRPAPPSPVKGNGASGVRLEAGVIPGADPGIESHLGCGQGMLPYKTHRRAWIAVAGE